MSSWLNAGVGLGNVFINGNIIIADDNIVNGKINLNGNYLTTVSNNLYFNGNLVTGGGNVQNVGDWALFPAIGNINMNNYSLNSVNSIYTSQLQSFNLDCNQANITNLNSDYIYSNQADLKSANINTLNGLPFQQVLGQVIVTTAQPIYVNNLDINKIWCFTGGTTADFIELEHLNPDWVGYVKNSTPNGGGGNDIDILYNNNPMPSPTGTNIIHQRTPITNTGLNIIYSTGSGLILL